MDLYKIFHNNYTSFEKSFDSLKISGPDAERFLNGQLTNDVSALNENEFHLQCRLDRTGKVKAFFYLLKEKDSYFCLVPKGLAEGLKEDLDKYIIMDDLEIHNDNSIWFAYWNFGLENLDPKGFRGSLCGAPCVLLKNTKPELADAFLGEEELETLLLLQGEPVWEKTIFPDQLVTDSIANLKGVSLSKGCFLGQETVSKIETRRGGAYFPVILNGSSINLSKNNVLSVDGKRAGKILWVGNFNGENISIASLLRDFRVEGRRFSFESEGARFGASIKYIPLLETLTNSQLAESLFEDAVKTFQEEGEEQAIKKFEKILEIDPKNEDSFEAIGVIFGRMEKYKEGLSFMDKVLDANPDSVMAHTNKSLFYMRLGEIEKAEEEKSQATVKSFSLYGKEAQDKKKAEELKKQEEAELNRRFDMFQQVLELDPDDSLANFGLADIHYHRGNADQAIPLLERVIDTNPKYSVGYLLLGKCFLALGKNQQAKEIFEKGIGVASRQGDLMPANEMQAKLTSLS